MENTEGNNKTKTAGMKGLMGSALNELVKELKPNVNIKKLKRSIAKKFKLKDLPNNIEILNQLSNAQREKYRKCLISKPVRTMSGVAPVAVMTKPIACPHTKKGGPCIYCPGGPDSYFGDTPQSYVGKEPAAMRAIRAYFDPYLQVFNRLEQYIILGQIPEKVELIVMGGTFPSFPENYKEQFVTSCFKAMNDFSCLFFKRGGAFDFEHFKRFFELPGSVHDEKRVKIVQRKILDFKKKNKKFNLESEQQKNEKTKIRCTALCIETRPDFGMLNHGNEMLKLGCTRVEVGVQSIYNDVLKKIRRGHTVEDTTKCFRILKDLGFKITAHIMIGLPGSNKKMDLKNITGLFDKEEFRPDMLKIYPCMVLKGTELYNLWKDGKYKALETKDAAEIIIEAKKQIPNYVRIQRIQRDIPTKITEAGVDRTNLRQDIHHLMAERGIKCNCIRCREVKTRRIGKVEIFVYEYLANNGKEFFVSAEDKKENALVGFCRLRFPSQQLRKEITKDSALIRELHVYSEALPINAGAKYKESESKSLQHKGYGKKLLNIAEDIAKKNIKNKMVIISGIGVCQYYRDLGYKKEGVYMVKKL